MGQITLIKRNGSKVNLFSKEPFCTVSSAVQNVTLMGDDNVQLGIKSTQFLEFAKGDKILVGGEEYSIRTKVTREILSENMYSYDAIFYGVMYELMKSQYRNCDANGKSTKSTFDLTYTLREFMHVVIYNVSRDYPGIWRFDADSCPDTDPVTLQFSKQNCLQVVQTVCKEYKYEFRIDQKDGVRILRVGKFGSKITPPAGNDFFEWGKGNGLYKLKEQKVDDKSIITRLWVEGGTQNIRSDYRDYSERLQLPYPKRLNQREHTLSDGTVIPAKSEYIGIDDDEKRYLEDPDLRNEIGSDEDTEYYDDIYPKRTGTVTALGGDIYSFVDDTMDFDLNEKDSNGTKYLINGVTAKLTFITGKLANQQFELKEKGGYVHSSRKFTLIKYTDERGMEFPSPDTDAFRFHEGDKYKITDINLPKSYEDYAEEDLWYAGYEDFKDRKQARAQYVLTFDRSYFINALPLDSETCVFHCGDYVPVKDTRYNIEKNIRIQKMSRNLLVEHDYTLTLSDTTTLSIQAQTVLDVIEHNIIIDNNRLRDLNKARRGWRTTEELRNMVYDTDGYFDVDNIKPNSIDTNMLTVGSKSQQFILIDTVLQANVNGLPNRFDATEGILAHLSIDDNAIKKWNMAGTTVILSETGGYYVFAKCSKTTDNGTFYITQEQLRVEPVSDPNNYYFQVGIIGSLHSDDNFRDFVSTYGFTRINGNTITTGKIVTSDGECYLDLDGNKFRIGDATSSIDWNVSGKKRLTLRNVQLLSDSGDLSDIGVYRGIYNSTYVYYKGDEVSYTANGETCTYRYINTEPAKGKVPTNSTYWAVIAKGAPGERGLQGLQGLQGEKGETGIAGKPGADGRTPYFHIKYSAVSNPTGSSQMSETPNVYIGTYVDFTEADSSDPKKYTWARFQGLQGEDGQNGIPGINGEDGQTSYLHIKYSDNGGLSFTSNNGEDPGDYIGQYTDFAQKDSDNPGDYTWSRTRGEAGTSGSDATAGEYFEYRYAKNGSTTTPPALAVNVAEPAGWSTTMPTPGALEYVWCTMSKKLSIVDKEIVHIPVNASDTTAVADTSGNGYNGTLSKGASVVADGSRYAMNLSENGECSIPYDLPWGSSFTLCLWMKTDQKVIKWMLNGYNGRDYVEKSLNVPVNTWFHLAFRFNDKTVTVFKNGELVHSGSVNEEVVGFALYDDDMFGSASFFDEVRILEGALPVGDINKVMTGEADKLIQNWSTPIRINPYDGKDGAKGEKGDSPATVFRGVYSNSSTYYGTKYRLDVVKYNGVYYVARIDAGTFSGKTPTDTSKWNTFGAQFDSVATQLLLAEFANIGNLILKNNCLISQKGTVNGVDSTDYTNANFVPNIMLDGANGQSVINGSLRSPFAFYDGSWYVGSDVSSDAERYDNLVLPISQSGGWETALSFPWTNKCNGRKITIVNYKWGNTISQGTFSLTAPSGKYFFENGILKSKIEFSREVIELLGYGDNNTFFGWIVIGRHDIGTTGKYGEVQKVMYAGEVRGSNSSAWFYKKFSFDGTSMSVSRLGEGYYRVYFGSAFSSADDYTVIMTGSMVGSSSNASMVYACLVERTASYFTVRLADDASTNDGGFIFQVISMRFSWT